MSKIINRTNPLETHRQLSYETYRQLFKEDKLIPLIAKEYNADIQKVKELISDPDHNGNITLSSCLETMVALELERDGILGINIVRGPKKTDLKDGWMRKWDVKTPPSLAKIPFKEEIAARSVFKKLGEFPNNDVGILLSISFLKYEDYLKLEEHLKSNLNDTQKFLVRQVVIDGCKLP